MKSIEDSNGILIYPSRIKYLFFSFVSLIFTLMGLFIVLIGFHIDLGFIDVSLREGHSYYFWGIIGTIGFIIFAAIFIYYTYRLIIKKPSIILKKDGFYDHASGTSGGFIKWSEIEEINIYRQQYKIGYQRIIGVKLKNTQEFINTFKGMKKSLIKMSAYPINIPQNSISIDINELLEMIKIYMSQSAKYNRNYK